MGTKHRPFWRAASMAIAALALMSIMSSCIDTRPWRRDRWERSRRTYLERNHDEHRDRDMRTVEPRSWSQR